MFSCVPVANGVYEFKVIDDNFIQLSGLNRLDNIKDFLTMSNKQTEYWNHQIATNCKEMSIPETLKYVIDLTREDSLLLLNECTASYCPCSRFNNHVNREVIEMIVDDCINTAKNVISVGPGGMLQDYRILEKRKSSYPVNYYVLDNFKDFFKMADKFEGRIDPYRYTGPLDNNSKDRAKWFTYKCMLLGTFLTALKKEVNLYLCESANDCVNRLKDLKSTDYLDNVVLGIDILDDYAELTLAAFTTVALQTPCTAFLISAGYWDVFTNDQFREGLSRDYINVISTKQSPLFNIYALYICYKTNRVFRYNLRKLLTAMAAIVGAVFWWYW